MPTTTSPWCLRIGPGHGHSLAEGAGEDQGTRGAQGHGQSQGRKRRQREHAIKKGHGDRREGKLCPEAHVLPGLTWPMVAGVLWSGNINADTYQRDSGSLRTAKALGVKF